MCCCRSTRAWRLGRVSTTTATHTRPVLSICTVPRRLSSVQTPSPADLEYVRGYPLSQTLRHDPAEPTSTDIAGESLCIRIAPLRLRHLHEMPPRKAASVDCRRWRRALRHCRAEPAEDAITIFIKRERRTFTRSTIFDCAARWSGLCPPSPTASTLAPPPMRACRHDGSSQIVAESRTHFDDLDGPVERSVMEWSVLSCVGRLGVSATDEESLPKLLSPRSFTQLVPYFDYFHVPG